MSTPTFAIFVLPEVCRSDDGQRLGVIAVRSFVERFAIYPFLGDVEVLENGWHDELRSLLDGSPAVGLPTASNMTWVLYRIGDDVRIRQMLMLPGVGPTLSSSGRVADIPAYSGEPDDAGRLPSEWSTTVGAVRRFLKT